MIADAEIDNFLYPIKGQNKMPDNHLPFSQIKLNK